MAYLFVSSDSQQQEVSEAILPVARNYLGRIQFGTVDVNIFANLMNEMHLEDRDLPALAIHEPRTNLKYPLGTDVAAQTGVQTERVQEFVQRFLDGKLKPTVKSQPIPSSQESAVIEVVALSYSEVILENDKDVLVQFYTQSCGPCKTLLPEYEELARRFAVNYLTRDRVTIAKIDYEENDVPDKDIRGFPWFKLYPYGRKDEPVTYVGERQVVDWAEFIRENGSHHARID